MDSISRSSLVLEITGKNTVPIEVKRHLAPRTVGVLLRSLPLGGNAHFLGNNIIYLECGLDSGTERARRNFKRGDIAFYPAGSSICFFTADASIQKPMSPIGRITGDMDELKGIKSGDVLSIRQETG